MSTETAIRDAAQLLTVELPELLGITGTAHADALEALAAVLADAHVFDEPVAGRRQPGRADRRFSRSSAATGRRPTLPPWSPTGRSRCSSTGAPTSTTEWVWAWRCIVQRGRYRATPAAPEPQRAVCALSVAAGGQDFGRYRSAGDRYCAAPFAVTTDCRRAACWPLYHAVRSGLTATTSSAVMR